MKMKKLLAAGTLCTCAVWAVNPTARQNVVQMLQTVTAASVDLEDAESMLSTCKDLLRTYQQGVAQYEQALLDSDGEETQQVQELKRRANEMAAAFNDYVSANIRIWEDVLPEESLEFCELLETIE